MYSALPRRALKWIHFANYKLLPLTVVCNFVTGAEPYALLFFVNILSTYTFRAPYMRSIVLLSVCLAILLAIDCLKRIVKNMQVTGELSLRMLYNRTIALKRLTLSSISNKQLIDLSYTIEDYQQYNGGPIIEAYKLFEEKTRLMFSILFASVLVLSFMRGLHTYILYGSLMTAVILTALLFFKVNTKIEDNNIKMQERMMRNNRLGNFYFSLLTSEFSSMKSVRNYSVHHFIEDKYAGFMNPMIQAYKTYAIQKVISDTIRFVCNTVLSLVAVLWMLNTMKESISLVLIFALFQSTNSVSNIVLTINNGIINKERLKNLFFYLDAEGTHNKKITHTDETALIRINALRFRYPAQQVCALQNINLTFEKGKIYTIVGLNGSGKTTLIKHLIGTMNAPLVGRVTYHRDIADSVIPYCPQKNPIFSFTIGENIALSEMYDNKKITDIVSSVQLNLHEPDILQCVLGHDFEDTGINLSGGQEQKIGIARALYCDEHLIILDEPTAALDIRAENAIYTLVKELRNRRTCIFVSHRLSSSTFSDCIIVMHNGQIVGQGEHATLLAQNAYYKHLFEAQAKHYRIHTDEKASEDARDYSM